MSDRVGVMERGRLVQVGTPREIYARPADQYVADLVGEANLLSGTVASVSDGGVVLDVPGARVAGRTRKELSVGDAACLVVRPEAVELMRTAPGDGVALPGTIADVGFGGDHWTIVVDAAAAGQLTATAPNRTNEQTAPPQVGGQVHATWSADDAWVI